MKNGLIRHSRTIDCESLPPKLLSSSTCVLLQIRDKGSHSDLMVTNGANDHNCPLISQQYTRAKVDGNMSFLWVSAMGELRLRDA